jgi:hypothetical protein
MPAPARGTLPANVPFAGTVVIWLAALFLWIRGKHTFFTFAYLHPMKIVLINFPDCWMQSYYAKKLRIISCSDLWVTSRTGMKNKCWSHSSTTA